MAPTGGSVQPAEARAGCADMHSRDWDREQARSWEDREIEDYERQERARLDARDRKHRVRLPVPVLAAPPRLRSVRCSCWTLPRSAARP